MEPSAQEEAVMVRGVLGTQTDAAADEEVRTNLWTEEAFAAAFRAVVARLTAMGMTTFGSGEKLTSLATWATPLTPEHAH